MPVRLSRYSPLTTLSTENSHEFQFGLFSSSLCGTGQQV